MNKMTIFMAVVLLASTLLAAGLAVIPDSIQDAQAHQCIGGDSTNVMNFHCDFSDHTEINEL